MAYGYYWDADSKVRDCEVIDVQNGLACIDDDETHERLWVSVNDVQPAAIDDWHETNGRNGVGA